jgi:hypothetical protein
METFFKMFKKKSAPSTYPGGVEPSAPPAPPGMFPEPSPTPAPSTYPGGVEPSAPPAPPGMFNGGKRKTKRYIKRRKSRKVKKTKRRKSLYKLK